MDETALIGDKGNIINDIDVYRWKKKLQSNTAIIAEELFPMALDSMLIEYRILMT